MNLLDKEFVPSCQNYSNRILKEWSKFASVINFSSLNLWRSVYFPHLTKLLFLGVTIILINLDWLLIILCFHSSKYSWIQRGIMNWLLFSRFFVCMQILYLLQILFGEHAKINQSISRTVFIVYLTITNHSCICLPMNLSLCLFERSTLLNEVMKLPFSSFFRIEFLTGKCSDCGLACSL